MQSYKMLIGSEWTESASGGWIPVCNPANGEPVGQVPEGGRADADAALRVASAAFKTWSTLPAKERCDILKRGTALARKNSAEIAEMLTLEQGKPLSQARAEVKGALDTLDYFAEEGHRMLGEIIPTESRQRLSFVIFQPVGVVSAIVPWNYPVNLLCWKLGEEDIAFQRELTGGLAVGQVLGDLQHGRHARGVVVGAEVDLAHLLGRQRVLAAQTQVIVVSADGHILRCQLRVAAR